jgi:hypothetical protein
MCHSGKLSWRGRSSHRSRASLSRVVVIGAVIVACLLPMVSQNSSPESTDANDVIQYLNQNINWYRQLGVEQQIADEPSDALVISENRQIANQVIRLAFDCARAQAATLTKQGTVAPSDSQNTTAARFQSLTQLSWREPCRRRTVHKAMTRTVDPVRIHRLLRFPPITNQNLLEFGA